MNGPKNGRPRGAEEDPDSVPNGDDEGEWRLMIGMMKKEEQITVTIADNG
jgi:hypothetical protein